MTTALIKWVRTKQNNKQELRLLKSLQRIYTMDKDELAKVLTDQLLAIIKGDYASFLTTDNTFKSVDDLTPAQRLAIDCLDSRSSYQVISKSKAIDMLAKISGLNSSTTKLEGGDEPLNLSFSISYVSSPKKDDQPL